MKNIIRKIVFEIPDLIVIQKQDPNLFKPKIDPNLFTPKQNQNGRTNKRKTN